MPHIVYDGRGNIKSIPLDTLTAEQYYEIFRNSAYPGKSAHGLFTAVPTLYACVDKRSKAVESVPFYFERDGERIGDNEDSHLLERNLRKQLYQFEASLCIFAATYAFGERNRYGFPSLRWVTSAGVSIMKDDYNGLIGFNRLGRNLAPDEIIHIWRNSLMEDVGPGSSPVDAAVSAAQVVLGINDTVAAIYKNGLIKAFIISVTTDKDHQPPNESDMKRLEQKFSEKLLNGVKSIFKPIAVRAGVKPEIISSDLRESYPADMLDRANDEMCRAMGVPQSLVKSEALAGGTVDADRLSFYDFTIIPEFQLIADELNDQYYADMGLTLEFEPDELEVYQSAQLAQAVTVSQLTGDKPILTVDEARELIGRDPNPELSQPTPQAVAQPAQPITPQDNATVTSEQDQAMQRMADERQQLKRYAHNRLRDGKQFDFKSNLLGVREIEAIKACQTHTAIDELDLSNIKREYTANDIAALLERALNTAEALKS